MKVRILMEAELETLEDALRHINMYFGEKLSRLSMEEVVPQPPRPEPKYYDKDKNRYVSHDSNQNITLKGI